MLTLFIEIGVILLFILNIYLGKKTKKLDLLLIATIFAAFFENLHILLFQNYMGGYVYSNEFLFLIYKTPLFVILSWGIIISNAYIIATKLTNKVARIFLVPILVVMVDFALEFFAVNQGYWTWMGYESTQGLFGAPASNFISWMLITLALVFCYEQLKEKWAVPVVAYILFALMSTGLYIITDSFRLDIQQQVHIIWAIIIIFAAITLSLWNIKQKEEVKTRHVSLALLSISAYYIFSVFLTLTDLEFARTIWPILAYVYITGIAIMIAVYYKKRKIRFISSFFS